MKYGVKIAAFILMVLSVAITQNTAFACWSYCPFYKIVQGAQVIVTGRIVRVEDPEHDAYQKALEEGLKPEPLTDYARDRATGYLKVEKVLKGDVKTGDELVLEFNPAMPAYISARCHYKAGSEGIWLLGGAKNGRWPAATPYAMYSMKHMESAVAIMKVSEGRESLDKYLDCKDTQAWSDLFEMVLCDKQMEDKTVLKWLACLPKAALSDRTGRFSTFFLMLDPRDRISGFSDEEMLFAVNALYCTAACCYKKRSSKDCNDPKDIGGRLALRAACTGACMLYHRFSIGKREFPEGDITHNMNWWNRQKYSLWRSFFDKLAVLLEEEDKLDGEIEKQFGILVEQLGAEKWRVREAAYKKIMYLSFEHNSNLVREYLMNAYKHGDLEQKHRIKRLCSRMPDTSAAHALRLKLLPNLALLLHCDKKVRNNAAKRLKGKLKMEKSLLDASLEKRTEFVLKALKELYPSKKKETKALGEKGGK